MRSQRVRLPPVDEEHDRTDHGQASTNEELFGPVVSGEVEGPSNDQDHSDHDDHARKKVPERVGSQRPEATGNAACSVLTCLPTGILLPGISWLVTATETDGRR